MTSKNFWESLQRLVNKSTVVVERPRGSADNHFPDFIYPFDYGFLQETKGGDGAELDVWLGSGDRRKVTGVVCTVDLMKRDSEVKILLGCSPDEMAEIEKAHNMGHKSGLLIVRSEDAA
jgi:inorganic pyrophosphatase